MDTPDILAILDIQDQDENNGNIGYTRRRRKQWQHRPGTQDEDKNNGNIGHAHKTKTMATSCTQDKDKCGK